MDMNWKQVLKTLAPTVASALGGPLAGAAVAAIGNILGVDAPTQDKIRSVIENGQLSGEQVAEIRKLEMTLKAQESELGFRYQDLMVKDVQNARDREVKSGDKVNRNLAYFLITSFVAVVVSTLAGWTKVDSVLAGTLIGYLSAKAEQVLTYYFGSTQNSARKTEIIAQSAPVNPDRADNHG